MASEPLGLVAVPRRFYFHWLQVLVMYSLGYTLPTKQPLRWILYRELSAREQMQYAARQP